MDDDLLHAIYGRGKKKGDVISAVMVCREYGDLIMYNEEHTDGRIQNSVVHEIAHYLLGHKAMLTLTGKEDFARGNSGDEDEEANHLTSCLLVPEKGLYGLLKKGKTIADVAVHYGVSEKFAKMCFNFTGGPSRLARIRRYR